MPPVLLTRSAIWSFGALSSLGFGDAKGVLVRLLGRTRAVLLPASPRGLGALVPDGAGLMLLVRQLPHLDPLVCVRVIPEPPPSGEDLEGDGSADDPLSP
jgi:hypothetical protein